MRPISLHSVLATVQGLDQNGEAGLNIASNWILSVFFSPSDRTAFMKLRSDTSLQIAADDEEYHLYISLPPERIASFTAEAGERSGVCLRLALRQPGDLIGPSQSPQPATEDSKRLLNSAQLLATRRILTIEILRPRIPLDHWQDMCRACEEGLVRSNPAQADISPLYTGRGGYVIDHHAALETPPAYDEPAGSSAGEPQSSRKRQRISPPPDMDVVGNKMLLYIQKMCDRIVERRIEELTFQVKAQFAALDDKIRDIVDDCVVDSLDKRLVELREDIRADIDADLDGGFDERCDALREELKEYVREQAEEEIREQVGVFEQEIVDKIAERIMDG